MRTRSGQIYTSNNNINNATGYQTIKEYKKIIADINELIQLLTVIKDFPNVQNQIHKLKYHFISSSNHK